MRGRVLMSESVWWCKHIACWAKWRSFSVFRQVSLWYCSIKCDGSTLKKITSPPLGGLSQSEWNYACEVLAVWIYCTPANMSFSPSICHFILKYIYGRCLLKGLFPQFNAHKVGGLHQTDENKELWQEVFWLCCSILEQSPPKMNSTLPKIQQVCIFFLESSCLANQEMIS